MTGLFFIGFLWGMWIISTFLLNKNNQYRFCLALLSLLLLISLPYKVHIFSISIQLPALILLATGYIYITYLSLAKKIYMLLSAFIIMSGFTGFLLIELYDPVWIFMDRRFLLGSLVFLLSQLLYSQSVYSRLACAIIATVQGDIIYSLLLSKWEFQYTAGSGDFLDICAIYFSLIVAWSSFNYIVTIFSVKNTFEKEKQG